MSSHLACGSPFRLSSACGRPCRSRRSARSTERCCARGRAPPAPGRALPGARQPRRLHQGTARALAADRSDAPGRAPGCGGAACAGRSWTWSSSSPGGVHASRRASIGRAKGELRVRVARCTGLRSDAPSPCPSAPPGAAWTRGRQRKRRFVACRALTVASTSPVHRADGDHAALPRRGVRAGDQHGGEAVGTVPA